MKSFVAILAAALAVVAIGVTAAMHGEADDAPGLALIGILLIVGAERCSTAATPCRVRAFEGFEPNDLVLYVESRRAVVVGDTLIDRGNGLEVHPEWPVEAVTAEDVAQRLRPLLDLSVDVVLPTHADPAGRGALERALSL